MQQKFDKNCLPINFDLDTEYLYKEALKRPRKVFYYPKIGKVDGYHYAPFEPQWLKDYIQRNFSIRGCRSVYRSFFLHLGNFSIK